MLADTGDQFIPSLLSPCGASSNPLMLRLVQRPEAAEPAATSMKKEPRSGENSKIGIGHQYSQGLSTETNKQ
jgi:hypothetical protein